ncbi:hypothetical protein [Carnobacterium sp.]|uniref:hypothetical protein n=1 Tax=Carnobacterium sp. TaxID=48221 RepID=UPI003C72ECEC
MGDYSFIKKVEQMIKPKDIATLQLLAPFSQFIPKKLQNKVMNESAKNNPYMGFVVEPYSVFLCYELLDLDWAKKLIPDGFELIQTKIFSDDEPKYYAIFGSFNVHTSAFWGTRLEVNIIARNKKNNLLSWVIIDYDTNTLSHDVSKGVVESTTEQALLTTDYDGNIIVDIENKDKNRALIFDSSMINSKVKIMDKKLWLEGNLSVGYGREISQNSDDVFSLKFDPKEVEKGFTIPLEQVKVTKNTWFDGLFRSEPEQVVYFPYAQHYLSDSPGYYSEIKNEEDMIKQYNQLDLDNIPDYSAASHRKSMKTGIIMNAALVLLLLTIILFLAF